MEFSLAYAQAQETAHTKGCLREAFIFPQHQGQDALYFLGNSLGLPCVAAQTALQRVSDQWAAHGVEGFFDAQPPWWDLETQAAEQLSPWVGAAPKSIAVLNALTVNLQFLMLHFYRPTPQRYKIIMEEKAFPSDQYLVQSQLEFHGKNPKTDCIEVPRSGHHWDTTSFLEAIEQHGEDTAILFLSGVNYYNGQKFDLETITAAAQKKGILVGLDLAHAVGNIPLELERWNVDFAAWCSYKYLNGGPGSLGGIYINEKHLRTSSPSFKGWWGVKREARFAMAPEFEGTSEASSWHQSTPSILALAPLCAALETRNQITPKDYFKRQHALTSFLAYVLTQVAQKTASQFEIITPTDRGAQLTVLLHGQGKTVYDRLLAQGVYVDWREPNAIRMAPTALYNTFGEIYEFANRLEKALA